MNSLDRAIFREIIAGNVQWGGHDRNADIGKIHLCRNIPTDKWHLVITSGNQVRLSWINQIAISIAQRYSRKP